MERKTLLNIFLMQKDELTKKIAQAASAKNLEDVRSTVASFFDTQLSPSGEYASQLTQAEFFIMQSAAFVKDLQKKLDEKFIMTAVHEKAETTGTKAMVTSTPMAFAYSIIGGLLGTAAASPQNGWAGAPLAGVIAGLALSVWLYKNQPDFITKHKLTRWIIAKPAETKEPRNTVSYPELNTSDIMKIFEDICVGIDEMMLVVSNQMQSSVPQTPEPKPIAQELGVVLKEYQKHLGSLYKAGINADIIGIFEGIWISIGVQFVHYSEETKKYFIEITGIESNTISEQYPAILVNGNLHLQGLVSLPESK